MPIWFVQVGNINAFQILQLTLIILPNILIADSRRKIYNYSKGFLISILEV